MIPVLAAVEKNTRIVMEKPIKPELLVNVNDVTRISEGAVLKGDLSSLNDIRLDGTIEGTIYSKSKVVVGEKSHIKGSILCTNADLSGEITGDIYVGDTLILNSSAKVTGGIHVNKFHVEMGARIDGTWKMITKEEFDKECDNLVKAKVGGTPAPAPAAKK